MLHSVALLNPLLNVHKSNVGNVRQAGECAMKASAEEMICQ